MTLVTAKYIRFYFNSANVNNPFLIRNHAETICESLNLFEEQTIQFFKAGVSYQLRAKQLHSKCSGLGQVSNSWFLIQLEQNEQGLLPIKVCQVISDVIFKLDYKSVTPVGISQCKTLFNRSGSELYQLTFQECN
ncbi:Hypothetical_protein [Hexamita inflata]|uniref:Hypothetical_protein n=1 Tax=Hexamita inflata TaxID=28002 RepID=A0AA86P8T4_9EUKA|nr:Hypothetical protein HINF_LOCUS21553 [Hexamita inflata]